MTERPAVPVALERAVNIEAGHRCAIPTCRYPRTEIAHIIPWSEVKDHQFENLIALCPNCHDLYDKDKKIDRKSIQIYKANLSLLNHRYGDYERRVLQHFLDNPNETEIQLWGREIDVIFLVKDELLKPLDRKYTNASNFPPKDYILTAKGREFVGSWRKNDSLT